MDVVMVHAYIWDKNHCYHDAPEEQHLSKWEKKIATYDFALFGDNHSNFTKGKISNGGCFIVRKSDEAKYKPGVTLLLRNGSFFRYPLNTEQDVRTMPQQDVVLEKLALGEDFIQSLEKLSKTKTDYPSLLKREMRKRGSSQEVQDILIHATEGE